MSWRIPAAFERARRETGSARGKSGLTPRLDAVYGLVPEGATVADIGADHGLLSDALLKSGRASFVWAVDVSERAVEGAMGRLAGRALAGQTEIVCGDGLLALGERAGSVECGVVAGTGAMTAFSIASSAAHAGFRPARWIFQPAGGLNELRVQMLKLGYGLSDERIVADDRRLFGALAFDSVGGLRELTDEADVFVGPWLKRSSGWEIAAWLHVQEEWLQGKLERSDSPGGRAEIARHLRAVRSVLLTKS